MHARNQLLPVPAVQNLHIDQLLRDASEVLHASEALFASLSHEQLTWKPNRKTWSILECFDHLHTVNGLYMPLIRQGIEKAREKGMSSIEPFKPSWIGRVFVWAMQPNTRFKMRTFKIFKPNAGRQNLTVKNAFIEQQAAFIELIKQADPYNLNQIKIASPESRLIRLSLGEAMTGLVAHERRHLLQAQNIQLNNKFPEFQV